MRTKSIRLDHLLDARVKRIARSLGISDATFIRDATLIRVEALEAGDAIAHNFFDVEMDQFDTRLSRVEHVILGGTRR